VRGLAERIIKKYGEELLKKKNVIGFERRLRKRIRDGKEVDELCFVVYVERKVPLTMLRREDWIPFRLDDIPTDVIEIGKPKALIDKTKSFRPLVAGVSIGHVEITAGTLGWFFENRSMEFLASNAHVFTPDPRLKSFEKRWIVQPGPIDGGREVVATYSYHVPIEPLNECKFARGVVRLLNGVAWIMGRKSRFELKQIPNTVDFAVAIPQVKYERRLVDVETLPEEFVGLGFAGSSISSLICKASRIAEYGFRPVGAEIVEVQRGEVVHKTGRTSCHTKAKVIGESATIIVNYGSFEALFTDVIVTEKLLEPGDSGSAVWR